MESWRLTQIQEELDHLEVSSPKKTPLSPKIEHVTFKEPQLEQQVVNNKHQDDPEIYSKIIIHKKYTKSEKEKIEEGLKKISDKYESLERVKPHLGNNTHLGSNADIDRAPSCDDVTDVTDDSERVGFDNHIELENYRPPSPIPVDHNPCDIGLSDQDILQIEMFYRSHKTDVFVCPTLANLYIGMVNNSGPVDLALLDNWQFIRTGVPVLVLDSGESRRQRKLHIHLAERGTGFSLWKDQINHLTNYKAPHISYHTMHLSSDHTKIAGFSYDDSGAASDFLHKILEITSNPDDDILHLSRLGKNKKNKNKAKSVLKKKYKAPTKADISQPCCFSHITKVDRPTEQVDKVAELPVPNSGSSTPSLASIQRRHSGIRHEQPNRVSKIDH